MSTSSKRDRLGGHQISGPIPSRGGRQRVTFPRKLLPTVILTTYVVLLILFFNWRVSARGGRWHTRAGRFMVWVAVPCCILPAMWIALYLRPLFQEHPDNNFPTPYLRRIIGLYGSSYIACSLHLLAFSWRKNVVYARALAVLNLVNTVWWLEATRFIHADIWGKMYPLATEVGGVRTIPPGYEPDSKIFKLASEMSFITTAFALWEPFNLYVLVKHGAFSSTSPARPSIWMTTLGELLEVLLPIEQSIVRKQASRQPSIGMSPSFDARRHHVLNASFLSVLSAFAPSLFFFHDTFWIFTEENGFGPHGLSWQARTGGMIITTLVPLFLWGQVAPVVRGQRVEHSYVDHFFSAWEVGRGAGEVGEVPKRIGKEDAASVRTTRTTTRVAEKQE